MKQNFFPPLGYEPSSLETKGPETSVLSMTYADSLKYQQVFCLIFLYCLGLDHSFLLFLEWQPCHSPVMITLSQNDWSCIKRSFIKRSFIISFHLSLFLNSQGYKNVVKNKN